MVARTILRPGRTQVGRVEIPPGTGTVQAVPWTDWVLVGPISPKELSTTLGIRKKAHRFPGWGFRTAFSGQGKDARKVSTHPEGSKYVGTVDAPIALCK